LIDTLLNEAISVSDNKMAICYNFKTKEPYLRLPEPHTNIIITPHRPNSLNETSSALVKILNDPRVALRLQRTPYPYSISDGERWVKANCKDQEGILSALREDIEKSGNSVVQENSPNVLHRKREFFDSCPFTCIREVLKSDSQTGNPLEDILIGDVRLARSSFDEYPERSEERCLAQKHNDELLAGKENIVWSLAGMLNFEQRYPDVSCTNRYNCRLSSFKPPWKGYHDTSRENYHL
jgi:hypothetical protein